MAMSPPDQLHENLPSRSCLFAPLPKSCLGKDQTVCFECSFFAFWKLFHRERPGASFKCGTSCVKICLATLAFCTIALLPCPAKQWLSGMGVQLLEYKSAVFLIIFLSFSMKRCFSSGYSQKIFVEESDCCFECIFFAAGRLFFSGRIFFGKGQAQVANLVARLGSKLILASSWWTGAVSMSSLYLCSSLGSGSEWSLQGRVEGRPRI